MAIEPISAPPQPSTPPPAAAPPRPAASAAPAVPPTAPTPMQAQSDEPRHPEYAVRLTFWQQPWVQTFLPFLTSVTFHATLILLGLIFFRVYQYATESGPKHQEEVIIPDASMINDGPPGGVPFQGLGQDPNRQAFQDKIKDATDLNGWANEKGNKLEVEAVGGGEGDASDAVIGLGPGGGFGRGKSGRGAGVGQGLGNGDGEGGPLSPFGTPGGGGIGPHGPVFGHGGNALRIAFVCDASGSMLNKFSTLKRELSKTVQDLHPVQSFDLIFFQEQSCSALSQSLHQAGLVMATPEYKRKAEDYLENVTPKGSTNPIPSLELAFKDKAQLVYLLTDGDFPDNDAVLQTIRRLNKDHKIHINTIAFVSSADSDTEFMRLLKTIADENGGVYKYIREDQL